LLRVGGYWEAYGPDAAWLRDLLHLGPGRGRAGLPQAAGFAARDTPRLCRLLGEARCPVALFEQTGRQTGRLRERSLRAIGWPEGCDLVPAAWLMKESAHRPGRPCAGDDDGFSTRRRQR